MVLGWGCLLKKRADKHQHKVRLNDDLNAEEAEYARAHAHTHTHVHVHARTREGGREGRREDGKERGVT